MSSGTSCTTGRSATTPTCLGCPRSWRRLGCASETPAPAGRSAARAHHAVADRGHLPGARPHPGLDVRAPLQVGPDVRRCADHDLFHAAKVRGRVRGGSEVDDRVAHQLARTVERERTTSVDPVYL